MRERIYQIIEKSEGDDKISAVYDTFMIVMIILSIIPLAFKTENTFFYIIDKVATVVFIIDYLLRWMTADFKFGKKSVWSFVRYPFSFMAIIDLLSILPSLTVVNNGFKALRVLRMIRAFRVFRMFKAIRYSSSFRIIGNVMNKSKNISRIPSEMKSFKKDRRLSLFSAKDIWSICEPPESTVGYGDIYPVSTLGRTVTIVSSVFGIAVVALPAGIVTAGYMSEIEKEKKNRKSDE